MLPVRLAAGLPIRIKGPGDKDGGWTALACACRIEALAMMANYPEARMPCWSRIESGEAT